MQNRKAVRYSRRTQDKRPATRIVSDSVRPTVRGRSAVHTYNGPTPAEFDRARALEAYAHDEDYGMDTWTHEETGLRIELVQYKGPASRKITKATANDQEDTWYRFVVRPSKDDSAVISERQDGERQDAIERVVEPWLANHPDGELTEDELEADR